MTKKIGMMVLWTMLFCLLVFLIWLCEENNCGIGTVVFSVLIAFVFEKACHAIQDFFDTTNWKTSQRKLKRGGLIRNNDLIRISFAYLYRIKIENKYFLVKNSRNTCKYQPVGGVYKMEGNEKMVLKNSFHVVDDDKIPIDNSSRDDYRLQMENRYLRRFVRRFDSKKSERERIDNVAREFREELIDSGILDWNTIKYRYCGRHMTELKFGEHFQIYELLLADVVELLPTPEQEQDLKKLMRIESEYYYFATEKQITSLGVDTENGQLCEFIGDHTQKTLQKNEEQLLKMPNTGKTYSVSILEHT